MGLLCQHADPHPQCKLCRIAPGRAPADRVAPKFKPAGLTTTCSRMSLEVVRLPGSPRSWRKCLGGFGSTTPDERAGHCCGCSTPTPGVWRVGHECGVACPGYTAVGAVAGGGATATNSTDPPEVGARIATAC